MRTIETDVLVIGGGATGAGVVADLALRGFRAVLVEKRDLTHGTTGRYHGLLHSGGRYAVKDPKAAVECIEEIRILRIIMPHALEDSGGYFVVTPWDDPAFGDRFLKGCQTSGIPCEEMTIAQMLKEEPNLNPKMSRCFRVPDATADSFLATQSVALGADLANHVCINCCAGSNAGVGLIVFSSVPRILFIFQSLCDSCFICCTRIGNSRCLR